MVIHTLLGNCASLLARLQAMAASCLTSRSLSGAAGRNSSKYWQDRPRRHSHKALCWAGCMQRRPRWGYKTKFEWIARNLCSLL